MNKKSTAVLAMMMLSTDGPAEFMAILSEIVDFIEENHFLTIPEGMDIFDLMRQCRQEVHKEHQTVKSMMANAGKVDPTLDED
jgi:hypothetical protein